jgi:hypothetical protein
MYRLVNITLHDHHGKPPIPPDYNGERYEGMYKTLGHRRPGSVTIAKAARNRFKPGCLNAALVCSVTRQWPNNACML